MSSLISAELVATCNSLGYFDVPQNKYYADENTLESVKDLIRYLKRDDESHDIRRQLGETKVVQTDLLPLLKNYWEQTDLFDVLLRLLVNLTTPALMLWNEEIPTDRTSRNQYLQIEEHLRLYKQAFADEAVWAVLSTRISKILEVDSGERLDEIGLIIERILILIRNILHVPADPDAEKRPDNDASVHDQVLWALHQSGMLDIILYVSSANEKAYYMHILEIMCYMLREQSAKELASAALQRSQNEKMRDEAELLAIRHKETSSKQQKARVFNGTRHSRFGGTFVVKSMKSISDNELIYHKPLSKLDELNFDQDKNKVKTPKNRAPLQSTQVVRRSAFSIRLFLKEFCVEFLNAAYNTFMYVVKERLARQQAQKHDETYYLWALRFFLEFNRCYKFDIRLVSETMSVDAFQYVQRQLETYSEMMVSDKKYVLLWTKRLHTALLSYRELLLTLCAMDKAADGGVRDASRVIKSNIFYVLEYRELILHLMVLYNDVTMTAEYLNDVMETQHVYLKLFEAYCSGNSVMVEERAKKKKKTKQQTKKSTKPKEVIPAVDVDALWTNVSDKLLEYLEGTCTVREEMKWKVEETIKDKLSDSEPTVSSFSLLGVQQLVMAEEYEEACALMLEAREAYPQLIQRPESPTEQAEEFHSMFFGVVDVVLQSEPEEQEPENNYEDEEDELEDTYHVQESNLKFDDFSKRLANPKVVRACALALNHFDRNTLLTNHCIVKLLHRIAFDSKMPTMLFQVSMFRVFQRIYEAKTLPQNKELVRFVTYIMRQFFIVAAKNNSVYMESLFWKSSRDANDIEDGYGSYQEKSKATAHAWAEHEEDELRRLFMEHQENSIERDVVDWIVDNLVDHTRTRRAVLKKLKEMYLLTDYKASKKSIGKLPPKQWSDEEAEQLRELHEQFKDAMDPLTCIMERLEVRRPKNRIVDKLLEMGVVQDKKELRKKRPAKSKSGADPFQYAGNDIEMNDSNSDSDDNSDDNESITSRGSKASSAKLSNGNTAAIKANKPQKSNRSKKDKKKKSKPKVSTSEISRMLIGLAEGETNQGLDWLKESLQDVAEDLENEPDDSDEGVPLVPILDYSVAAMESPEFLTLLRALGIQEPTDGQESYWRIPSSLSFNDLQEYIGLLTKALKKTLTVDVNGGNSQDVANIDNNKGNDSGSEDDYVFGSLNKNSKAKTTEENCDLEKGTSKNKMQELLKKMAMTKSTNALHEEQSPPGSSSQKNKKTRLQIESSSDEDDVDANRPGAGEDESNRMSFRPSRIHDFDSDDESATKKAAPNEESTQEMFKSARVIIESDDEEDAPVDNNQSGGDNRIDPEESSNEGFALKRSQAKTNLLESDDDNSNKENVNNVSDSDETKRLRSGSDSENEKPKAKRSRVIISDDDDDD